MSTDICYIISHGFAARMLLQTNLIGRLTDLGLKVALVSQNAKDENLAVFSDNPNVQLIEWKSKSTIWDDDYLYKRMYYLEDIDANTALKEKFYNALFYSTSKHPWKRIRPLFYYFIVHLVKLFPAIRTNFLKKEGKYLQSNEATAILKAVNPKLIVSTYPVSIIEAKMLYAAKRDSRKTLLHLLSWDNITCKGKFPVLANEFIVWGDIMQEELQEYYGVEESKITKCGVPHFDQHIAIREHPEYKAVIQKLGLDPEKPYLFFAMSSPRFAPREIDIVEWLSKAIEQNMFGNSMQLVVRPHPQNVQTFMADKSWLRRLDKLKNNRVAIDYPRLAESKIRWSMKQDDMVQLSNLITGCTVSLNSGSTVSIDSLLHNKPVILTSFDGNAKIQYWNSARRLIDYTHLKKYIAEGGATTVDSYSALEKAINQFVKNPDLDLNKRRNTLYRECYLDDGKATQRVIEALKKAV